MSFYLFKYNWPVKKFAADLRISPSYLYQLLRKERKQSLHLALRIEHYTDGEVSVEDLCVKEELVISNRQAFLDSKPIEKRLESLEVIIKTLEERVKILERNCRQEIDSSFSCKYERDLQQCYFFNKDFFLAAVPSVGRSFTASLSIRVSGQEITWGSELLLRFKSPKSHNN